MDDPANGEPLHDPSGEARVRDESGDLSAVPSFLQARTGTEAAAAGATAADRFPLVRAIRGRAPTRDLTAESRDPGALPLATISPRRVLSFVAVVALAWGVISFGQQVVTASTATSHAADLRMATATLQDQVKAMQRELTLIQQRRYVDLQARAYRLGNANEIPFALQPNPPSLAPDAPGSASVRLGAPSAPGGPTDTWLRVLFGPG